MEVGTKIYEAKIVNIINSKIFQKNVIISQFFMGGEQFVAYYSCCLKNEKFKTARTTSWTIIQSISNLQKSFNFRSRGRKVHFVTVGLFREEARKKNLPSITLKPWYNESRYSEFHYIVNKTQLPFWGFTKHITFNILNYLI